MAFRDLAIAREVKATAVSGEPPSELVGDGVDLRDRLRSIELHVRARPLCDEEIALAETTAALGRKDDRETVFRHHRLARRCIAMKLVDALWCREGSVRRALRNIEIPRSAA